jgi:hypothetical protein
MGRDGMGQCIQYSQDNNIQFSLWNNGEWTGQYMWINGDRTEMIFGQYVQGKIHGEKRIFTLNKREMWNHGECTKSNL